MTSLSQKHAEIKHTAERLFATKPDWMKFYREVMGLHGLIRRIFPNFEAKTEFEQTETFREIQRMLAELRKKTPPKTIAEETRVITVRIPQSMHEALRIEALERHTTMNKLCISKLVQFVDTENVPTVFEEKDPRPAEEEEESEVGQ
jgi:predicted HicB family RNase H-like nuclease